MTAPALFACLLLVAYAMATEITTVYGIEAHVSYAIFIAFLVLSAWLVPTGRLDLNLGHLSYPLFLAHVPMMWVVKAKASGPTELRFTPVWIGSLLASAAIYFLFDLRVNRFRVGRTPMRAYPVAAAAAPSPAARR